MNSLTYGSIKRTEGWLSFVDFELLKTITISQNESTRSAIVEIGVHHGKSFVPLAYFSEDRKMYAIDIFGDQSKNIDKSGMGDKDKFLRNLERFEIDIDRVVIDQRMSNEVDPQDILRAVGPIGIFHIDGGHHIDAVSSDINLACAVADECGVIVLDDMFRSEWPEVSAAAFSSETLRNNGYRLFAVGFNKGYWCKSDKFEFYQELCLANVRLSPFLHRIYSVADRKVLIFQQYPLPEWRLGGVLLWYLSIYHPLLYAPLRSRYFQLRGMVKRALNRADT